MKILKNVKVLLAVSLLTASCTSWATPSCEPFSRIIDASHERPASIIFNPVDQSPTLGNHYQLKELGLYSDDDLTALDANSIAFFNEQLGLDFNTGAFPFPIGGGLVGKALLINGGYAVLVPYLSGQDGEIPVVNDTKGNENKRIHVESGNIVLFIITAPAGGTIPGGLHAGAAVQNQDNYFYGNIDIAKKKNDGSLTKVENFKATSDQLGRTALNQWGVREFYITLNLVDKNNKVGYGHSITVTDKVKPDGVTVDPTVRMRNTYTWSNNCPLA